MKVAFLHNMERYILSQAKRMPTRIATKTTSKKELIDTEKELTGSSDLFFSFLPPSTLSFLSSECYLWAIQQLPLHL